MARTLFSIVFCLYVGILAGELPVGKTTLGRTAWEGTRSALTWSGKEVQAMISMAGFGEAAPAKAKPTPPAAKIKKIEHELLTPLDKEALRQLLE